MRLGSYPPGTNLPTVVGRTPPYAQNTLKEIPWFIWRVPFVSMDIHPPYGAFTLDVKAMLNENLDGILGGTQC